MKKIKANNRSGFSILLAMIAMAVVSIAVLGTMNMRYQTAVNVRCAKAGATASRLALMFIETWKGSEGSETFDAAATFNSELTIQDDVGPSPPFGFTPLGNYKVELNSFNYFITLSYQDINLDMRALNSNVAWEQRGTDDSVFSSVNRTYALTSYIQK